MKTIIAVLMTLALAVPAFAQVPGMWERPAGECSFPDGTVVVDPGIVPLPCDPIEYCVAWDSMRECVATDEYVIPDCTAMSGSPEYWAAFDLWLADTRAFQWCVLIDYWVFLGGLGR